MKISNFIFLIYYVNFQNINSKKEVLLLTHFQVLLRRLQMRFYKFMLKIIQSYSLVMWAHNIVWKGDVPLISRQPIWPLSAKTEIYK